MFIWLLLMSSHDLDLADAVTIIVIKEEANTRKAYDVLALDFSTRIHQDYVIEVTVISDDVLQDALRAKRCFQIGEWYSVEVRFYEHHKLMYLQGLCTAWEATGQYVNEYEIHKLTLRSELYNLFTNKRSGIYYGGSLHDVIQKGLIKLCQESRFNIHTQFENKLSQNTDTAYPVQLSLTQYYEADMAFILRQMRQFGAWFNFYQPLTLAYHSDEANLATQKITVTLGDDNSAFLPYPDPVKILHETQSQGDGLYEVKLSLGHTAIGTVEGIFYDEITGKTLTTTAKVAHGQAYRVLKYTLPQTTLNQEQMQYQTQVVADSLTLRQQCLEGGFQGLFIQAGNIIKLDDETFNIKGEYLLSEVSYQFSKINPKENNNRYQQKHSFKAYPLSLTYREALVGKNGQEPELYRSPKYQGVMPGVFALTQGAHTVTPDALGSIPLWFPYNYWYTCQGQTCRYTRVISQANQGGRSGVSFPYYQDTEFILMFINGDLDRSVIKGTAANNLTGHLHNQSVQKRSALALPQGQHLVYSNVPNDQNFLKLGATHNEGDDETHMLLSNYPDPDMPGAKKLDYQQATTKSYERVTQNNFSHQSGGNQVIRTKEGKTPPKTYLLIQLCDQSNQAQPAHKPLLSNYLSLIAADLSLVTTNQINKLSDQAVNTDNNYAFKILIANNTNDDVNLESINISLKQKSPLNPQEAVNAIAVNNQSILPNCFLRIPARDWQSNRTTDGDNNVYFTVYITLLPPANLINFRQNFYLANKALTQEQQETYQVLQPYFSNENYDSQMQATLDKELVEFYQNQGNNVLIFIHGFHVGFGTYPTNFVSTEPGEITTQGYFTLYRTQDFIKNRYGDSNNTLLNETNLLYGTGAKNWLICMEYNLNKAFGFDDQDYSKYTRIIGITWQGNPCNPENYMAAVPMTEFAAQKVFVLIKQLTEAGLKVELMAHSLGNAVLARALDLCGKEGVKVEHAHMWQPAIPDNALDTEADNNYLAMLMPNNKGVEVNLPADYNYIHARDGAKEITVLFSDQDTILGPTPQKNASASAQAEQAQAEKDIQNLKNMTFLQKAALALNPIGNAAKAAFDLIFAEKDPTLWQTIQDPGAGWGLALPAAIIQFMDDHNLKVGNQNLLSIYHVANLFRYPLSYFFQGTEEDLVTFYNDWQTKFKQIAVCDPLTGSISKVPMKTSTYEQALYLFKVHPTLFSFAVGMANAYYTYKNTTTGQPLANAESNETQTKVKANLTNLFTTGTLGLINLDWEKVGTDLSESCKQSVLLITVFLTILLTPEAVPLGAMGYYGPDDPGKLGLVNQNGWLPDHTGMLYPAQKLYQKIYKNILADNSDGMNGINYFGKWKPA